MDAYGIMVAHGMSPESFWEMTWREVYDVSKALNTKRKEEARFQASLAYKMSELTILGVGNLLSKSQRHFPSRAESFPGLFDEVEEDQDWETMQMKFRDKIRG